MRVVFRCGTLIVMAALSAGAIYGAEATGKLETVSGRSLNIVSTSDGLPRPGDSLVVYFEFPEEGEVTVAEGVVEDVVGRQIRAMVIKQVGTLAKGQLVRIQSQRAAPVTTPVREQPGAGFDAPRRSAASRPVNTPAANADDDEDDDDEDDDDDDEDRDDWNNPDEGGGTASDTAFISTRDYTGKIFNGKKAIATLTLRVNEQTQAVEEVVVNDDTFDRFNGMKETAAGKPLVISRFPVLRAPWGPNDKGGLRRMPPVCDATIQFDPKGVPGGNRRKLYGVIKTNLKQVMQFEVQSSTGSQGAGFGRGLPPEAQPPAAFSGAR